MEKQPPEERAVKGTMVLDIVKTIHGLKDQPWDQFLSPEAQALCKQKILPSTWYPFDPAINCLNAVYRLLGGNKPENAKAWGRVNGRRVFENVYKSLIVPGNAKESLKKLNVIAGAFVKGGRYEIRELGERHMQAEIFDEDPRTEVIYYFIQGWIEVIIEITDGKKSEVTIVQRHWEGHDSTILDARWGLGTSAK
jgi:hypothetical protein